MRSEKRNVNKQTTAKKNAHSSTVNRKQNILKQVITTYIPTFELKMKSQHGRNYAGSAGSSQRLNATITNDNNAHHHQDGPRGGSGGGGKAFRNRAHFFNLIATILFATIMIVNVRHSCGLIENQTEKEKHGK